MISFKKYFRVNMILQKTKSPLFSRLHYYLVTVEWLSGKLFPPDQAVFACC